MPESPTALHPPRNFLPVPCEAPHHTQGLFQPFSLAQATSQPSRAEWGVSPSKPGSLDPWSPPGSALAWKVQEKVRYG